MTVQYKQQCQPPVRTETISVLVSQRTKAQLQQLADARCRPLANLCYFILETDRRLQTSNGKDLACSPSALVSPDPNTARIAIRCDSQWKESVRRQARTAGKTLTSYCNHLFERYAEAELGRVT